MTTTQIISIVFLAVLGFWAVGAHNRLVRLRNAIGNAFAQIDVQLKRRYDLIPNLVETAKKYLQHERETLEAVTAARNQARAAADVARGRPTDAGAMKSLGMAEQVLTGAMGRLMALVEARPHVLSRAQIEAKLYNWDSALESNAIEVHVHRLRRKLGEGLVRTVRGVGYYVPAEPGA